MAGNDSRIIVVRAWRNAGETIMRVIAARGGRATYQQWVFCDTYAATDKIAELLEDFEYANPLDTEPQGTNFDTPDDGPL